MSPTPVPNRITIDFRDAVHPSRAWILGVDEGLPERVELIAFDRTREIPRPWSMAAHLRTGLDRRPRPHPTAVVAECACPEFCERDHVNE